MGAVVYNDEIHIIGGRDNSTGLGYQQHYKWNETDGWTSVGYNPVFNGAANGAAGTFFVYKEHINVIRNNKHWLWNETDGWVQSETKPCTDCLRAVVHDGKIHFIGDSSNPYYWTWDGEEWAEINNLFPTNTYNQFSFSWNDNLYTISSNTLFKCSENNSKAPLTFGAKNTLSEERQWNDSTMNAPNYAESSIRTWLNGEFYKLLPASLQGAMQPTAKYTYNKQTGTVDKTEELCWLLSDEEIGYTAEYMQKLGEGTPYSVFTDNASRMRRNDDDIAKAYWLRSPYYGNINRAQHVPEDGRATYMPIVITEYLSVVFGFCI